MGDQHIETILTGLTADGWIALPNFLNTSQLAACRELVHTHLQQGDFRQAGIGSGKQQASNPTIRGDSIHWLEQGVEEAVEGSILSHFQQFLDGLRLAVNQALYLGVFEYELHFAQYLPGAVYQKHIDNFQGWSPRILTFILYLNQDWQPEQGGQLRLYTDDSKQDGQQFTDILPKGGTLVVFLSERFYHAVLPASRERLSLTGWLRRRDV